MNKSGQSEGVNRVCSAHICTVLTRGLIRQRVKAPVWVNQASLNNPKAQILSTHYQSQKCCIQKRLKGFLILITPKFTCDVVLLSVVQQTTVTTHTAFTRMYLHQLHYCVVILLFPRERSKLSCVCLFYSASTWSIGPKTINNQSMQHHRYSKQTAFFPVTE